MPDFAEDQKNKAQLPRLPWLIKNQKLSAVPVELSKLQPGWSDGVIQVVPQLRYCLLSYLDPNPGTETL